jgi:zinc transport system ATP-binding protein
MAIKVSNLSFSYEDIEVLSNISFEIKDKDFVALIGPNGSGKTTLTKLILGFLEPQKGKIEILGNPIKQFTHWDLIGYVPQKYAADKNFPATVEEILSLKKCSEKNKIVKLLGLEKLLTKQFTQLSGGQQQRVVIALSMLSHPEVLILDEPTVGVDMETQHEFYALLKQLNEKKGVTIILVTHDIAFVSKYAKSILCINKRVCGHGKSSEINSIFKKVYGKEFELVEHGHHHD